MADEDFQIPAKRYPPNAQGCFVDGHEMITTLEKLHASNENIGGSIVLDPSAGGWQLKIQALGLPQQVAGIGDCVVFSAGNVEAMTLEDFEARYVEGQ